MRIASNRRTGLLRALLAGVGAAAPLSAAAAAPEATLPPLLKELPGLVDPELETEATIVRSRPVTWDAAALPALDHAAGARVAIGLFDEFAVDVVLTRAELLPSGSVLYRGRVEGPRGGWVTLVRSGHVLVGDVQLGLGGLFNIRVLPAAEGQEQFAHVVRQIDPTRFLPCGTGPEHAVQAEPEGDDGERNDDGTRLDVLVVYTPAARAAAGGRTAIEATVDLAISLANLAYANSNVNTSLNLVYTGVIDYTESGNASTDLGRFRSTTDNHMDIVHCLRDAHGADFAALITNELGSACGIAYLMTSVSTGFATSAFSATRRSCISGHTFAHEIGHNLGSHHDRGNAGSSPAFPYSYGWRTSGNQYRTVMSYSPGTRVPYFSNPDVTYQGHPMGRPVGEPDAAHNALSINNTRTTAANFRAALGPFYRMERVNISSSGVQANVHSGLQGVSVSSDARYVAFSSLGNNLVPEDTNASVDVFVHDRTTGLTTRDSMATGTVATGGGGWSGSISNNGRYLAFISTAQDLVPGGNSHAQLYLRDRNSNSTTRLSNGAGGVSGDGPSAAPAVAGNGSVVVFQSDAGNLVTGDSNGHTDIFARILPAGSLTRISTAPGAAGLNANGASRSPAVSADGRYVAFESDASNLVAGDTNGATDVFVHDRQTGSTTRISVATGGGQANGSSNGPRISADGRFVVFTSQANNLVPSDSNNAADVYIHDRALGTTRRVSLTSMSGQISGASAAQGVSADGRLVFFTSAAHGIAPPDVGNHVHLYVRDLALRQTRRLTQTHLFQPINGTTIGATPTPDGRHIFVVTHAYNMAPCDSNGALADVVMLNLGEPVPPGCPADINADTMVNSADISAFIGLWLDSLSAGTLAADFNDDNVVNSADISAFISTWLAAISGDC